MKPAEAAGAAKLPNLGSAHASVFAIPVLPNTNSGTGAIDFAESELPNLGSTNVAVFAASVEPNLDANTNGASVFVVSTTLGLKPKVIGTVADVGVDVNAGRVALAATTVAKLMGWSGVELLGKADGTALVAKLNTGRLTAGDRFKQQYIHKPQLTQNGACTTFSYRRLTQLLWAGWIQQKN